MCYFTCPFTTLIAIPIPNKKHCQNQPFCHLYTGESVSKAINRLHIIILYIYAGNLSYLCCLLSYNISIAMAAQASASARAWWWFVKS